MKKQHPPTITNLPYFKNQKMEPRKELKNSTITKSVENSISEIIKQDEMMFTKMEPKVNRLFIVKITNINGHDVIPSYCIKSIERPEFVKSFFGYKLLPITLSCYDPISPPIAENIQFYLDKNILWNVSLKLLGPVGDVVEEWILAEAKILRVKYSNLNWSDTSKQPAEISIQIQAKTAKLIK